MLNLDQQNEAVSLPRRMVEDGFCVEFPNVFARCLPRNIGGATDQIDWDAVTVFEAWILLHPNLQDAVDFLRRVLDGKSEWKARGLEARLAVAR